ncbi:MAG TPA: hypothetical protein VFK92_07425 [Burkholderiales bacterium]|nr:hypothetical protein [Burkholderiales bacterium]
MTKIHRLFSAVVLASLFGCAGSDFVRSTPEAFKLGATTFNQVVRQMGEPRRIGEVTKNGAVLKSISYSYAATGGEPLEQGVIPVRVEAFFFHNDTLVGQEFLSSFKSDNTNFDDTKIPAIVKGKTTRSEVIQLLGRPSTMYIPPMIKEGPVEAVGYLYQTTSGGAFVGFKIFRKALTISLDGKGLVVDIDYSSSGSK